MDDIDLLMSGPTGGHCQHFLYIGPLHVDTHVYGIVLDHRMRATNLSGEKDSGRFSWSRIVSRQHAIAAISAYRPVG